MASIKEAMTALADAIRAKTGKTDKMTAAQMADEIAAMKIGGDENALIDRSISGDYVNNDVKTAGNYCFYSCSRLTSISLPNCTKVGRYAFGVTMAQSIYVPLCESIGDYAFTYSECTSLSFPVCKSIGVSAFRNDDKLTTIDLPNCTSIGNNAFDSDYSLASVCLDACQTVGNSAFSSCTALQSISLPACTTLSKYAFYFCKALVDVTIGTADSTTICTLESSNVFNNTPITGSKTGYIYVADALVDTYKRATNWSVIKDQIKGISEKPSDTAAS